MSFPFCQQHRIALCEVLTTHLVPTSAIVTQILFSSLISKLLNGELLAIDDSPFHILYRKVIWRKYYNSN